MLTLMLQNIMEQLLEPSRKSQDVFEVYNYHFPDSENINVSIADITDEQFAENECGYDCRWFSMSTTLWLVAKRTNKVLKDKRVSFSGKSFERLDY